MFSSYRPHRWGIQSLEQNAGRFFGALSGIAALALAVPIATQAQTFTAVSYPTYTTSFVLVTPSAANPIDLTVNTTSSEQADSGTQGNFLVFNEKTVTLTTALAVDLAPPKASGSAGTAGTIPAGTLVSSLYFHYDGPGTSSSPYGLIITFNKPILGLETGMDKSASGSFFAIPGVTGYNTNGTEPSDVSTFAFNGNQLILRGATGTGADDIRVLLNTAAPEPDSATLCSAMVVLAGIIVRRRARCARRAETLS